MPTFVCPVPVDTTKKQHKVDTNTCGAINVPPHAVLVYILQLVQQQQIERVQCVNLVSIKIPILIRIILVRLALPRVLAAPNLLLVQQQQIERVQVADRDNIKIRIHMHLLLVKVVRPRVVVELNL